MLQAGSARRAAAVALSMTIVLPLTIAAIDDWSRWSAAEGESNDRNACLRARRFGARCILVALRLDSLALCANVTETAVDSPSCVWIWYVLAIDAVLHWPGVAPVASQVWQ